MVGAPVQDAAGSGVAEGRGVTDGPADGDGVPEADADADGLEEGLPDGLALPVVEVVGEGLAACVWSGTSTSIEGVLSSG